MTTPPSSPLWSRWLVGATALLSVTVTACSQGSDPSTSPSPAASSSASPSETESPSESATDSGSPSPSESTPEAPAGPTLEVRVSEDEVTPVAQQLDLAVGETLTIEVRADRAGELHVHSDPEQLFGFGVGTERFEVTLEQPGAVDLEEHESGALIARLLVR